MKIYKKYKKELEELHIKFNQEVKNYKENGEEDFKIWLLNVMKTK